MKPKILLVDDREDNIISMEAVLAPYDFQFVRANSGKQALKVLLQEIDFALILMDVNMPNLNGFETASLIYERERLKHIPIIFITAHNFGEENVFKGYKAGAVDYVYKPINPDLLRAKVAVFADLYKKNRILLMQEQKLLAANKTLENEVKERKISEEKVKVLNLELLKNIDRLETANKDLDRFAFMASHDLQEPLRKIRTYSEFLRSSGEHGLNEAGRKIVERIDSAAERMQALVKDILMFSKVNTENMVLTECDLQAVIRDVWALMEDEVNKKGASLEVGELPRIVANPVLIHPLFHNLIANAIKYSRAEVAPKITISCGARSPHDSPQAAGYHRILIEDNGIGFDQQYAEEIFSMFKRLHHQNEYEGTGVGLALCRKIVEQHQGFITARGKKNEGATFIISLPIGVEPKEKEVKPSQKIDAIS